MLRLAEPSDLPDLAAFLQLVDLTTAGLDSPGTRLWLERDRAGRLVGSTGYEQAGDDVLVRSVAVHPDRRTAGHGTTLARFALERAAEAGARRAWLFSRRSGPFWRSLGFEPADRDALATALAATEQVRLFTRTGQLGREVAWSRPLP